MDSFTEDGQLNIVMVCVRVESLLVFTHDFLNENTLIIEWLMPRTGVCILWGPWQQDQGPRHPPLPRTPPLALHPTDC